VKRMDESKKNERIDINLEDLDKNDLDREKNIKKDRIEIESLPEKGASGNAQDENVLNLDSEELPQGNEEITLKSGNWPVSGKSINSESASQNNQDNGNRDSQTGAGRVSPSRDSLSYGESTWGRRKKKRGGLLAGIIIALVLLVLVGGAGFFFFGDFPAEQKQATDRASIGFSTAEGVKYDSPAGIHIEVEPIAQDLEAELIIEAALFEEPEEEGILEIYGTYDIEIKSEDDLPEHPLVKINFLVPSSIDAKEALILYDSIDGLGLPGGTVAVDDQEIELEVEELSRFILVMPCNLGEVIPLIREQEETSITVDGHAEVVVKLEAVEGKLFGFGSSPWYSLKASSGVNQVSVEAPGDWHFSRLTDRHGYLAPNESKDLVYTFYGVGGESSLWLSASGWDAIVMTWIDALHRLATGEPLPWPIGPDLLEQSDELAALMALYEYFQAESNSMEEEQWHEANAMSSAYNISRYFWEETQKWAAAQGENFLRELLGGVWWRFTRTADLFVAQVIYAIAGETEYAKSFYVRTTPQLQIKPDQANIEAGESIQFEAVSETLDGDQLSLPDLDWSVSGGGNINTEGLYQSDSEASGEYEVLVRTNIMESGGKIKPLEESAKILVDKESTPTTVTEPEPEEENDYDQAKIMVSSGESHSLALGEDGIISSWGLNNKGQLGIDGRSGTAADRYSEPVPVKGLTEVSLVEAGRFHTLAIKNDGTAWAWGNNYSGQLGDGSNEDRHEPVIINHIDDILKLGAGNSHSLAVKSNGTLWAWGDNAKGQLGDGTQVNRNVPVQVNIPANVKEVSGGGSFTLALTDDGKVWAWGSNEQGQVGNGEISFTSVTKPSLVNGLDNVKEISAGNNHSLALKSDGTVWSWGGNIFGQLGDGTNQNRDRPVQVSGLTGILAVSAGENHSYALDSDGSIWAWGSNSDGRLGDGTTDERDTPVRVKDLHDVIAISAGSYHGHALTEDRELWSWGSNTFGQLGDGTTTGRRTPVESLY